ncbi:TMEM175 family protein [Flavobacterium sp. RHBU_24]|uniref:TMEM175 family protein n=1 Tax=Flavobacterium sp. RHBU_24 TaxID=3391185 RepID=UPI003984C004
MQKGRLEAFSDGVLAIIITIMVLEIKVPHDKEHFADLLPLLPVFLSYVLSFLYIGIYWNNHHHMMHTVTKVNGPILWANHHLLFWLSLVPFVTGWMGENHFAPETMALYGFILLMSGIAYVILQNQIIKSQGENSLLKHAIGSDIKGKLSPVLYSLGIASGFINSTIAAIFYVAVALMWLIPDKRIERIMGREGHQ